MSTTKDDGTEIGIFVSEEQVSRTAQWVPGSGEPPLSITHAVEIAMDWAKTEYTRYDDVKIREISLQEYGCSLTESGWLYIVDLRPIIDGNTLWGPGNWVAVLMDGTVIGPTEKP